jgi:dsDNA-specific endonuclease/ATPase MutS2
MNFDPKEFAASLRHDLPELDLHGKKGEDQIESAIDQFLYQQFNKQEQSLEVIYGIGTGRMKETAVNYLSTHPLVEKVIDKGGSCIVLLHVHI